MASTGQTCDIQSPFRALLRCGQEFIDGTYDLDAYVAACCVQIREITQARGCGLLLRDVMKVSGPEPDAADFRSLVEHPEAVYRPHLLIQPIPCGAGCCGGLCALEREDGEGFSDETGRLLAIAAGLIGTTSECRDYVAGLAASEAAAREEAEAVRNELAQLVGERQGTEDALQEANTKLTEWVYELEQRHRDAAQLKEITDVIHACISATEAHKAIAEFLPRLFPNNSGALYVYEATGRFVEAIASWGDAQGLENIFLPEHCWSLRRAQLHWVRQATSSLRCTHLPEHFPGWTLCAPLVAHGRPTGLLHVNAKPWSEDAAPALLGQGGGESGDTADGALNYIRQLVETTAAQIGIALANLDLREALRKQAVRDPLTGLFNRRYLEETMLREIRKAERIQASVGCIMMDLDHFKRYNDTRGHAAGDMVLRRVAEFLIKQVRPGDFVCRYGGEEFTIILPGAPLEVTMARAETIRAGLAASTVDTRRGEPLEPITISAGVSAYPNQGLEPEAVLKAADEGLYQAKHEGRNRVCLWTRNAPTAPAHAPEPAGR